MTPSSASSALSRRNFLKTSAAAAAVATLAVPAVHAADNDKIKIGLVGCGGRGRGAAADAVALSKNVQVTAIADLFPDRIEETKKLWADRPKEKFDIGDRAFSGWDAYKKLLATDVNYVILASPPGFRPMMMQAAIEAGKHVFAEKPVAVDPAGVRLVIAASAEAAKKNLAIGVGSQRRHDRAYMETIKRIQDGAIGKVVAAQVYWTQGGAWMKPRLPEWSDMEWQLRNWPYFVWLAGDHIVEQHMHQHDIANWILGSTPKLCIGSGGRQVRIDPAYGHVYDHFAIDYEYSNGARVLSMCRQMEGTYGRVGEHIIGTKGHAFAQSKIMPYEGGEAWTYEPPTKDQTVKRTFAAFDKTVEVAVFEPAEGQNPYEMEHSDLIASIRAGAPINEGKQGAESSLTAIMGRMSAYTGKLVSYAFALKSQLDTFPKKLEFGPMPVPPVAMPGQEPLI